MKRYIKTGKMGFYFVKFAFRIIAFIILICLYVADRDRFYEYTEASPLESFNFMHLMWCVFMGLMLLHIFPPRIMSMGAGKIRRSNYVPVEGYSEEKLLKYVQNENRKAWKVMLFWFAANGTFGALFFAGLIGKAELLLLTTIYFISDYICILIFCPFQTFGQRDRCCVACRIYDWGHFFMFTPMLFMGNFYGISLFCMGSAVIVHWEVMFTMHPERFWDGSNQAIRCANCHDRTCTIKREVTGKVKEVLKK